MHIKQVIVQGFKSYKDAVTTQPFDPRINVIVGANGSGKTNLFHAIRFVVNDVFVQLRPEERQQLIHEGSGNPVKQASVEVVLDNKDRRFPADKEEVRLKRCIGLQKDELFVDKKHITRKEFTDLLEAAGISRSNPYYVVQQGKIMSMANMRDSERLELLKEIGGVKVYEERRKESDKILENTKSNRGQIEDMISNIETKLSELEDEREELVHYQQLDKKRRSIEFTLHKKELQEVNHSLAKLDMSKQEAAMKAHKVANDFQEVQSAVKQLEKDRSILSELKERQLSQLSEISEQKAGYTRDHARLEMDIEELRSRLESTVVQTAQQKKDLAAVESVISQQNINLEKLNEDLSTAAIQEESRLKSDLDKTMSRLQLLLQKQGRDAQFSSKQERDRWIMNETKELQSLLQQKTDSAASLRENATQQIEQLENLELKTRTLTDERDVFKAEADDRLARQKSLLNRKEELQTQRLTQFKHGSAMEEEIHYLKERHSKLQNQLEKSMPMDLKRSIDNCMKVVQDHRIEGVYGILGDLLTCSEQYFTAVEVAAKNQLFNVIVDRSDIAERIISYLIRDKLGRVTFIPLDKIQRSNTDQTKSFGNSAYPLVKFLKIPHEISPVLHHVFGKTVLAMNMDIASEIARRGFNCVTIEGDEIRRNGSIKGGFYDTSRSRLRAIKEAAQCREEIREKENKRTELTRPLDELDQNIAQYVSQINEINRSQQDRQIKQRQIRDELRQLGRQKEAVQREYRELTTAAEAAETRQEQIRKQIEGLREEQGAPLNSRLTTNEKKEIRSLNTQIKKIREELDSVQERISKTQEQRSFLEKNLEKNLKLRREELEDGINEGDRFKDEDTLKIKRRDLALMKAAIENVEAEEQRIQSGLHETNDELNTVLQQLASIQENDAKSKQLLDVEQSEMDKFDLQRLRLEQKKEELEKKILDMGSIPDEAYGKYNKTNQKALYAELKRTKAQLAKMTRVNKKAADQFVNFSDQKKEMCERHDVLLNGQATIDGLMRYLDLQKDEAIERTFKGVAKHFAQIFSELVPEGKAELVMQKRIMEDEDDVDETDMEAGDQKDDTSLSILERFSGVKVKVSFSQGSETTSIKQLSGGQKTLVALTLIFAIQRCDPAPFYLFDEIDAALDPLHRAAVAQLLKKQVTENGANPTQFILTTFHPQLVQESHRIYGVMHQNRISAVHVIDVDQAMDFLQSREQEIATASSE